MHTTESITPTTNPAQLHTRELQLKSWRENLLKQIDAAKSVDEVRALKSAAEQWQAATKQLELDKERAEQFGRFNKVMTSGANAPGTETDWSVSNKAIRQPKDTADYIHRKSMETRKNAGYSFKAPTDTWRNLYYACKSRIPGYTFELKGEQATIAFSGAVEIKSPLTESGIGSPTPSGLGIPPSFDPALALEYLYDPTQISA